jgi:CBS domain-containing protein
MKIGSIFHPGSPYASPEETLRQAATQMRSHGLSCIPVMSGGLLAGILTERDVVEAVAKGARPMIARVGDYMNDGAVTVSVEDDTSEAAMKMLAIGCRHLPVMTGGKLAGIVSDPDGFLADARAEVRV